jgi:hypothetical protein
VAACVRPAAGKAHGRTGDSCQKSLISQSEIDKQSHITVNDYSPDEYRQLSPAKKAKLWQLHNPGKTHGTGPTRLDRNSSIAKALATYSNSGKRLETSVFGAEFITMKHGIETLMGLRYKVCMMGMGIPLTGPSYIYGDNKSQVTNLYRPESTLKKKCDSIC